MFLFSCLGVQSVGAAADAAFGMEGLWASGRDLQIDEGLCVPEHWHPTMCLHVDSSTGRCSQA